MLRLVVNGEKQHLDLDPSTPLVLALRHDLGLLGARSCQTPLSAVDGREITTPEGTPRTPSRTSPMARSRPPARSRSHRRPG